MYVTSKDVRSKEGTWSGEANGQATRIGCRWASDRQRRRADAQIAQVMGCSVWTVRKWRRAYQHAGRAGLVPHMGRPARGSLASARLRCVIASNNCGVITRDGCDDRPDHLSQEEPESVHVLPSRGTVWPPFSRRKD